LIIMIMAAKLYFVSKAHRQHNSLLTVIPVQVRRLLDIARGDILEWVVKEGSMKVVISVAVKGVIGRERSKRNTNRINQGRGV